MPIHLTRRMGQYAAVVSASIWDGYWVASRLGGTRFWEDIASVVARPADGSFPGGTFRSCSESARAIDY